MLRREYGNIRHLLRGRILRLVCWTKVLALDTLELPSTHLVKKKVGKETTAKTNSTTHSCSGTSEVGISFYGIHCGASPNASVWAFMLTLFYSGLHPHADSSSGGGGLQNE